MFISRGAAAIVRLTRKPRALRVGDRVRWAAASAPTPVREGVVTEIAGGDDDLCGASFWVQFDGGGCHVLPMFADELERVQP